MRAKYLNLDVGKEPKNLTCAGPVLGNPGRFAPKPFPPLVVSPQDVSLLVVLPPLVVSPI